MPCSPTTRDVDMRSIPSATTTAYSEPISMTTTTSASSLCHNPTTDGDSNSNNSTGVVRFEYSQYLKDSNLAFDRCDACKYKISTKFVLKFYFCCTNLS